MLLAVAGRTHTPGLPPHILKNGTGLDECGMGDGTERTTERNEQRNVTLFKKRRKKGEKSKWNRKPGNRREWNGNKQKKKQDPLQI